MYICIMYIYTYCIYIYIYIYIHKEATHFSVAQRQFIFHLYFLNQIEFDLKSMNEEFLLFLKLLKKHSIQLFNISQ